MIQFLVLFLENLRSSHVNVGLLDDIETRKNTSSSNTSEDVSASTLHEGHEAFVLDDLHTAVEGGFVVDTSSRGHHHSTSDGIDGVGGEARDDGDGPSEEEGDDEGGIRSKEDGLDGIVKTEVKTSVDEDTDAGDGETSVETGNTVGSDGLLVDIDETVVLSLTVLALGVVGESGSGVVEGVDDGEGHGTSETTGGDVGGELDGVAGVLGGGEESLDLSLEGEVEGLSGEVSEDVGKVSSPEGSDTFRSHGSSGAVNDTGVSSVKDALLDHLILVLDEELDSLDGGGGGLGDTSGNAREHELFEEVKLLGHG